MASGAKPPLRLLTTVESYGLPQDPRGSIWIGSQVGDYALAPEHLGTVLSPLSGYLDNMLVVSGVNARSMQLSNTARTHNGYTMHALTGSKAAGNDASATQSHASIDVHIGEYMNDTYGLPAPRVYSHLAVSDYAESGKTTFCFDPNGNQIRAISSPQNIASALFGSASDFENAGLNSDAQRAAIELVGDQLRSIRGDLVSANRKVVMDAYESSVQDLALELELRAANLCEPVDVSAAPTGRNPRSITYTYDCIHQAFSCDLASSVTYMLGGETINQHSHSFLYDSGHSVGLDDAALQVLLRRNLHSASHSSSALSNKVHELVRQYQMAELAGLLDRMRMTPDINGGSLFDNTVVFVTSAMSHNTHQGSNYAHLIIAGDNANLRGGYHYDCVDSTNNDLLTTLAQGMTLPDTSFGGFKENDPIANIHNGPITKMLRQEV